MFVFLLQKKTNNSFQNNNYFLPDQMKILFYIDGLQGGGKERRLVELMKVLILKPEIEFELAIMDSNIHYKEVIDMGIMIHFLIRKTKKDLSVIQKLFKLCKAIKPDIVHCWDGMTAVYSVPVCKVLHIPLINGMVTNSPRQQNIFNPYWLRAKLTFPFSDSIIGNSRAGLSAYNAPSKKSIVIYNGFNFSRIKNIVDEKTIRSRLGISTKFVIGMVASFSKFKDYKTYFKAAQVLLKSRNDVTFLAIGSDTDSEIAKSLIDNKYKKYFRLLGKQYDVESYIRIMDVCVLSTFTEGISNSILEYMALGKPVVATSGGGTNEIIENDRTGFLVEVSNSQQLSDKLHILLEDENLRSEIGIAGKERIHNVFSIDAMLAKYLMVYRSLIT